MEPTSIPSWWRDILRAVDTAMMDCDDALSALERELETPADYRPADLESALVRWGALNGAVTAAFARLDSKLSLSAARTADVLAYGAVPPAQPDVDARMQRLSARCRTLAGRIRDRMAPLAADIASRRPRRPNPRLQRPSCSSLDIRV